jgi:hypothetical protein
MLSSWQFPPSSQSPHHAEQHRTKPRPRQNSAMYMILKDLMMYGVASLRNARAGSVATLRSLKRRWGPKEKSAIFLALSKRR